MTEYYDDLETRSACEREQHLLKAIGQQLIHARENTEYYSRILAECECEKFSSLADLKDYPITRKSAIIEQQKRSPPLGGFGAFNLAQTRYVNNVPWANL